MFFWKIPIKFYGYITEFYGYFTGSLRVWKLWVYYGWNYGFFCIMVMGKLRWIMGARKKTCFSFKLWVFFMSITGVLRSITINYGLRVNYGYKVFKTVFELNFPNLVSTNVNMFTLGTKQQQSATFECLEKAKACLATAPEILLGSSNECLLEDSDKHW